MEFLVGIVLALAIVAMGRRSGLDRERGFYPIVLMVSASYYGLFAVMGGAIGSVIAEMMIFLLFLTAALRGFRKSAWLVVLGLAGHGLLDFYHSRLISNSGVPGWWPMFCLSFDFTAALYLAWRLAQSSASDTAPLAA